MRGQVTHGCYVRERQPRKQLREVVARLDLYSAFRPFTRCMDCNGPVRPVAKESVDARLQPLTRARQDEFWQCEDCAKVYWHGTHYQRMRQLIESLRSESEPERTEGG